MLKDYRISAYKISPTPTFQKLQFLPPSCVYWIQPCMLFFKNLTHSTKPETGASEPRAQVSHTSSYHTSYQPMTSFHPTNFITDHFNTELHEYRVAS